MKIGIVSDTHDNKKMVEKIFSKLENMGINYTIHLGDLISPFVIDWIKEHYSGHLILTRGNNDGELAFTLAKINKYGYEYHEDPHILEIEGKKLAIMHKPVFLNQICETNSLDFILYGHTHKVDIKKCEKTIIINPGEGCGYLTGYATFAILDIETGEVEIERP